MTTSPTPSGTSRPQTTTCTSSTPIPNRKVMYYEMIGHPFGIGAAATNYNRKVVFINHVARVFLALIVVHFYDDSLVFWF